MTNPTYDFTGQVAFVTGAAKGMGLAAARRFAESRASVLPIDLDGALAATEAARITQAGGKAIGIGCDVGDEEQVAAAVLWLCSPAASFVIGVALPVDGGFTAH